MEISQEVLKIDKNLKDIKPGTKILVSLEEKKVYHRNCWVGLYKKGNFIFLN